MITSRESAASSADRAITPSRAVLQRKCACGNHAPGGGSCEECRKKAQSVRRSRLARNANEPSRENGVPDIVHDVLSSPGQSFDPSARSFFESRFGHDFSQVRVHTDANAAESARSIDARAYTVGRDIAFGQGQYQPATPLGRSLIAHELTHVMQQGTAADRPLTGPITLGQRHTAEEHEAERVERAMLEPSSVAGSLTLGGSASGGSVTVARADAGAVTVVGTLGTTVSTGVQFWPVNVTDTQVGPVSARGGLLSSGAGRLNAIIGGNMTVRTLARQLLPLWITATPFTPPGAAAPLPLDIIDADRLAQALLVYNDTYFPVPAMTNWRAGLRVPLPIDIDEATGMATLHPLQIRALAGAFDPAWTPLLDLRAAASPTPPAATLAADVTAFLARETTALARGVHLGARAVTNAVAERPFIRQAFSQLGAARFDVALELMNSLVNREVELLAGQRDGAAILADVRGALGAGPAVPTAVQQASLDRANRMLGRVAATVAVAAPAATRARAEKTITIDTVRLDGSTQNPATEVALADGILAQCNVRVSHGVNATASAAETQAWLGDTDLRAAPTCGSATLEERRLFREAAARFGLTARFRAFFPATISGIGGAAGYSYPPFCATALTAPLRNMVVLSNTADSGDLAHELGHILLNSGAHPAIPNVMNTVGPPQGETLTNPQCGTLHSHA